MIERDKLVDTFEAERSLPLLFEYLDKGEEPLISNRTLVFIDRYAIGWRGLYKMGNPHRLTLEGGTLLLGRWYSEMHNKPVPEH